MKKVKKVSHGARHLIKEAKTIFNENNELHAKKKKSISTRTQTVRWQIVVNALVAIYDHLEFKVQSVEHIKQKHIIALASYWEHDKQYSPGTIQNNISVLRTFFHRWLGKDNFIPTYESLFSCKATYQRRLCAERDKSWSGNGVDIGETILNVYQYDERVAVQLIYCAAFGLRVREAVCCRPYEADLDDRIQVKWGSKGGRYREVSIDESSQLYALELMKAYSYRETGSTIPPKYNLKQWMNHFYYTIRVYADLTFKGIGVTSHGLRHEFAINKYQVLSGLDAPVRKVMEATVDNKKVDREARVLVSELLGHSRPGITSAYIGQMVGRYKNS